MINLCCQTEKYDPEATPWVNVLFVFNTLSPTTYLSKNARAGLGFYHQHALPLRMHSCGVLDTFPPPDHSHVPELNILGIDLLQQLDLKVVIYGGGEFKIAPS